MSRRSETARPRIWLGPDAHPLLARAIERGGGTVTPDPAEATAIVWSGRPLERMREVLHPAIEWVQLDSAGVDRWLDEGIVDRDRRWTAVHAVYAPDVAEHAVACLLAAARRFPQAARRTEWRELDAEPLAGRTVGLVGAGAIGQETIARLRPFGVRVLALTRSGRPVESADRSLPADALDDLLGESDYVVLALPLTLRTRGLIGERELHLVGPNGWLVNVARGPLVDTDALVRALAEGRIAGACLDVTDPEPLPPDHPLWRFENVLVTPHVANPPGTVYEPLARLVEENVRRFVDGRDLLGEIDPERGY
jgi:phosphoglycerate dehydrogenase-like enzyme